MPRDYWKEQQDWRTARLTGPTRLDYLAQIASQIRDNLDVTAGARLHSGGYADGTLGEFTPSTNEIDIYGADSRPLGDLVSTLAHEMFHAKQHADRHPSISDDQEGFSRDRWTHDLEAQQALTKIMPEAYDRGIHSISELAKREGVINNGRNRAEYLADAFGDSYRQTNYPELPFDQQNSATLQQLNAKTGNYPDSTTPLVEALVNLERNKQYPTMHGKDGFVIPQNMEVAAHLWRDLWR